MVAAARLSVGRDQRLSLFAGGRDSRSHVPVVDIQAVTLELFGVHIGHHIKLDRARCIRYIVDAHPQTGEVQGVAVGIVQLGLLENMDMVDGAQLHRAPALFKSASRVAEPVVLSRICLRHGVNSNQHIVQLRIHRVALQRPPIGMVQLNGGGEGQLVVAHQNIVADGQGSACAAHDRLTVSIDTNNCLHAGGHPILLGQPDHQPVLCRVVLGGKHGR